MQPLWLPLLRHEPIRPCHYSRLERTRALNESRFAQRRWKDNTLIVVERRSLIDKLPPEILHATCAHLKPTKVATSRLLSRAAASAGLRYLVYDVHLILTEDSFNQARAIAEHPVVAKNVTSFVYIAGRVQDCDCV